LLTLRSVRMSDRDLLLGWRNQPEVARWMFTDHLISVEEHAVWFSAMLEDPNVRYWIIELDHVPQGVVHLTSISSIHQRCEWGIYLGETTARGTGAAEAASFLSLDAAFSDLSMERVTCEVLATNERALGLYKRIGFRREGCLRSYVTKSSERHDVLVMSILRPEWETLRPGIVDRLQQRMLIEAPTDGS
jgi:UDP-4-amino-4,6-dideoxy-N-acetyl-beta-L-altrosamine N-acetyltransferase